MLQCFPPNELLSVLIIAWWGEMMDLSLRLGTFFCDTCCITPLVELLSELKVIWAGGQWTQAQARV